LKGTPPVVRLEGISKRYGATAANQDIRLDIHARRIRALLGENGAGKSTLMGVLSGMVQPDSGRILIDGQPRAFRSAREAIAAGIGMVYQHFMLVKAMTVAENIFLGYPGALLNRRRMERTVAELARRFGLDLDPAARIGNLSMGERQRVEILKLLFRDSRVLIFDEPTSVLTPQESSQLFDALRRMATQGKAIVFITHKLDEVMALSDDITILRRGAVIDDLPTAAVTSKHELARRMVGRDVLLQVKRDPYELRQLVLRVDGLCNEGLRNIQLDVRQGEILAVVGVAGNGQKPLVEAICGLTAPAAGSVSILGEDWHRFYARRQWDGNLAYIPEDRRGLATCRNLDLTDNFLLTTRQGFCRGPWLQRQHAARKALHLMIDFAIQPQDTRVCAWQLSGGNLQKLVLAREFFRRPRLIVAEQPTQGLDIAAMEDVWNLLLNARKAAGILLITGDLTEALMLADRLAVMSAGRIVDTFPVDDADKLDRIGLMMAGSAV
jgi:ABC-type uncharacterized transport system ATPase subunit